jgi:hypothetical protein
MSHFSQGLKNPAIKIPGGNSALGTDGTACAKALGQDKPGCWRAVRRLCGRSRGSEGERERQGGDRQVVQGPVGFREDLGFDLEGGGKL